MFLMGVPTRQTPTSFFPKLFLLISCSQDLHLLHAGKWKVRVNHSDKAGRSAERADSRMSGLIMLAIDANPLSLSLRIHSALLVV